MENAIKRIIAIDREAEAYLQKSLPLLKEKKLQFEEDLKKQSTALNYQLSEEKRMKEELIFLRAEEDILKIDARRDRVLGEMKEVYKKLEHGLVEELFEELLGTMNRV